MNQRPLPISSRALFLIALISFLLFATALAYPAISIQTLFVGYAGCKPVFVANITISVTGYGPLVIHSVEALANGTQLQINVLVISDTKTTLNLPVTVNLPTLISLYVETEIPVPPSSTIQLVINVNGEWLYFLSASMHYKTLLLFTAQKE